jgi:hypothetical protein
VEAKLIFMWKNKKILLQLQLQLLLHTSCRVQYNAAGELLKFLLMMLFIMSSALGNSMV